MKLFSKSLKYIQQLDAFGQPIEFNIDGKAKYKSLVGGIVTIFILVSVTFLFQSQIMSFFNRDRLFVEVQQDYSVDPIALTVSEDDYIFAIAVDQPTEYPFNERPFLLIEMFQHTNGESERIELMPCPFDPFSKFTELQVPLLYSLQPSSQSPPTFAHLPVSSQKCRGLNTLNNFNMFRFQSPHAKMGCLSPLGIMYEMMCHIQTCAPSTIIQEELNRVGSLGVSLITSNYVINPDKKEHFSQFYISQDLHFQVQPGRTQTTIEVPHRTYTTKTDNSLFLNTDYDENLFVYREVGSVTATTIQSINSNMENYPLVINLKSDNYSFTATRQFMKIDQLLSYLGGIFQLFIVVFGMFMSFYNKTYFKLYLANKLYDFKKQAKPVPKRIDTDANSPQKSLLKIIQELQGKPITDHHRKQLMMLLQLSDVNNATVLEFFGFHDRIKYLVWFFHRALGKNTLLQFSLSYILYVITCKRKLKTARNRTIDEAIAQIEDDMNIKHIVNHMIQIEKLKSLLLSKQQLQLFNFFHKPQIHSHDHHHGSRSTSFASKKADISSKITESKFLNLVSAYKGISDLQCKKNNKLLYFLGEDLRKIVKACVLIEQSDGNLDLPKNMMTDSQIIMMKELNADSDELQTIKRNLASQRLDEGMENPEKPGIIVFEEA